MIPQTCLDYIKSIDHGGKQSATDYNIISMMCNWINQSFTLITTLSSIFPINLQETRSEKAGFRPITVQ